MSTLWRWGGIKAARQALLYAALLFAFARAMFGLPGAPLHADEFVYIHHSNWLSELGRGAGAVYQVSGDTLRDPPVTPFLIGLSFRSAGYADAPAYEMRYAEGGWSLEGAVLPDAARLWFARFPMAALYFLTLALSTKLLARIVGMGGAAMVTLGMAGSQYLSTHLLRAMTEGPMLFFLMALIFATAQWWDKLGEPLMWRGALQAAGLGALAGLGIASKHNAAVNVVALWAALTAALNVASGRVRHRIAWLSALWLASGACALAIFIALTPILHTHTLSRIQMMLAERSALLARQQAANTSLDTVGERLEAGARRTFNHYAPANCARNRERRVILEASPGSYRSEQGAPSLLVDTALCAPLAGWVTPLALINAGLLLLGARCLWRACSSQPASRAYMIFAAANVGLSVLLIPLDWDRYYLLPVFFGTTLIMIGVTEILGMACRALSTYYKKS